jgi:predicted O-methyltransferase YrrM
VHPFNEHVRDDPRVEQVLVPIRDGVTLIRKRA